MRYKEYNPTRVLDKSIALFWQKGYNGCSINDLVEATGVNRYSLYHEFGNKEGILYASLDLYRERYCQDKLAILNSDKAIFQTLEAFYGSFLSNDNSMLGCYFIHVGTELADSQNRIKENLNNYLAEIEDLLNSLLRRKGYQPNAKMLAKHLVGLFCTVMSFCLIHTPDQRDKYISNGINVILS